MLRAVALAGLLAPLLHAQTAVIEGIVTNAVTHGPVVGVSVVLSNKGEQYDATTDPSGVYRIEGAKPGSYGARFYKDGFLETERGNSFQESPIMLGSGSTRLDAQLMPFATLSGRVLEPDGKPAAGVPVETQLFDFVETDSEGRFTLDHLRPGSYTIVAKPKPAVTVSQNGDRVEAVATFFPAAIERANAQPIAVHGGDELSGFEIRLHTAPVYRVRGVVLDETGKPVSRPTVKLLSASEPMLLGGSLSMGTAHGNRVYYMGGGNLPAEETFVLPEEDGAFEFPAVRPGKWAVRGENESVTRSATVDLTVVDRDVDGLEIRFAPRFTLHGTVDWGDRQPPAGARGSIVFLHNEDGTPAGKPPSSDPEGNLTFPELVPGHYRIITVPGFPAGYYAASVLLGNRDVRDQTVELTADSPSIRIAFRPNAARVRGVIQNGAGATVLLWPQTTGVPDLVPAVECGANGAFEFTDVPPGDYYVLAFDKFRRSPEGDAFLRNAVAGAARVTVEENSAPSVELSVIHWPE